MVSLLFSSSSSSGAPLIDLRDAAGDTRYSVPAGDFFTHGALDITRLTIDTEGNDYVVLATFAARIPYRRGVRLARETTANLFPMNVEIYIDQKPLVGFTRTLPGRRVEIARESAWDAALVITSRPAAFASEIARLDKALAAATHVAREPVVRGRTLTGRFPRAAAGEITRTSGFVVLVTPAAFRSTFRVFGEDLLFIADIRARATACSLESPDLAACDFGGCAPCGNHPRVVDAIIAPDADERAVFSAYDPTRLAVVPASYPEPPARAPARPSVFEI